jgi:hypothetical protein
MSTEVKNDTPLKDLIVNFVGNRINPKNDFPEFLLSLAEENWINGYTQALNDVDFVKKEMKKQNVLEEYNKK